MSSFSVPDKRALARLFLLHAALAPSLALPPLSFTHSWDTALAAQFIDVGYTMFSPSQAAFVASHYAVVSLEKCFQPQGAHGVTEASIWRQAAALKALNPAIKVLFYLHTDIVSLDCYAAHATYMAHPEWWLTDAAGNFINSTAGQPLLDTTQPAARAWWASIPLNGTTGLALLEGSNLTIAYLVDGVLADGTGRRCQTSKVNASRCSALVAGKAAMVRELQGILAAANGGAVFGNGIDMSLPPDYNLGSLPDMGGIMLEHFACFENLRPNGTLNPDMVAASIQAVADAAASGKPVVVATWPGLIKLPFVGGLPSWPGGTQPNTTEGWRAALARKHAFALAGFLIVAEANVWQQYEAWYQWQAGALACPEAPASCIAPEPWYPALYAPLGPPLGPATRSGNTWTRAFAQALAGFNVDDPDASSVSFFSATPSLSPPLPSPTPTPTQSPTPQKQQLGASAPSGPAALSPGAAAGLAVALLLGAAACGGGALLRWRSGRLRLAARPQAGKGAGVAQEAREQAPQVEERLNPLWPLASQALWGAR